MSGETPQVTPDEFFRTGLPIMGALWSDDR